MPFALYCLICYSFFLSLVLSQYKGRLFPWEDQMASGTQDGTSLQVSKSPARSCTVTRPTTVRIQSEVLLWRPPFNTELHTMNYDCVLCPVRPVLCALSLRRKARQPPSTVRVISFDCVAPLLSFSRVCPIDAITSQRAIRSKSKHATID